MQKVVETVFAIPPPAVPGSSCRIRIFSETGMQPIIVVSHIPGSRGTSITNMFEEVASKIRHVYKEHVSCADPAPIWVQQYPADSLNLETEERLHLVTFGQDKAGRHTRPCWTPVHDRLPLAPLLYQLLTQ